MTTLVKIHRKGQMTLPSRLRNAIGVAEGDLVEATVLRGKIVLTPKTVLDRIPTGKAEQQQFFKKLRAEAPEWLRDVWAASKRRGTDKLTMNQINDIVAEARPQQPKKKTKRPAA